MFLWILTFKKKRFWARITLYMVKKSPLGEEGKVTDSRD